MTKTKAGERKRTITLTVGPIMWGVLEEVLADMNSRNRGLHLTATDILGAAACKGLEGYCTCTGLKFPDGMDWLGD